MTITEMIYAARRKCVDIVVGGVRIDEPGGDLAVLLAIVSSF